MPLNVISAVSCVGVLKLCARHVYMAIDVCSLIYFITHIEWSTSIWSFYIYTLSLYGLVWFGLVTHIIIIIMAVLFARAFRNGPSFEYQFEIFLIISHEITSVQINYLFHPENDIILQ